MLAGIFCSFGMAAQPVNLIPNPGFEYYEGFPLGWNYSGKDFNRILKYWNSPTNASPDVYGPDVIIPKFWKDKGFGNIQAAVGESMVGITLFGCKDGKPHCREYLQVELFEPLIPGQRYRLQCLVNHLERSLQIDKLGFYFSPHKLEFLIDNRIPVNPQLETQYFVRAGDRWKLLTFEFVAESEASFLIIGNFALDQETHTTSLHSDPLPFAYYYLDEMTLEKLPPILEAPLSENDLRQKELEIGAVIQLHNIYFDLDKSILRPKSYVELYQLLNIMLEHRNMKIEVIGHTDELGTNLYNQQLSEERANAVAEFLYNHGIETHRVEAVGFGSSQPVAENNTTAGRQMNRRVEIRILTL
jgi:outer membrane protein OmpA-like peptidoglycan-associated protein